MIVSEVSDVEQQMIAMDICSGVGDVRRDGFLPLGWVIYMDKKNINMNIKITEISLKIKTIAN